jgi:type IV secretory pathway TrbL component
MSERATRPRGNLAGGAQREAERAQAQQRLGAMRARAGRIRHAIAALAAVLFVCAFLVIYVNLVSGHDPALAAAAKRKAATSSKSSLRARTSSSKTPAAATTSSAAESGSSEGSSTGSSSGASGSESAASSGSSSSSPSAVTTSQS